MSKGYGSEVREGEGGDFESSRVLDARGEADEQQVEAALRPKRLAEFPGQTRVRDQLDLVLQAIVDNRPLARARTAQYPAALVTFGRAPRASRRSR